MGGASTDETGDFISQPYLSRPISHRRIIYDGYRSPAANNGRFLLMSDEPGTERVRRYATSATRTDLPLTGRLST